MAPRPTPPPTDRNRKLLALLIAMVVVPLAAVGWVGLRLVSDQSALARHEVSLVFGDRLSALDRAITSIVKGLERELSRYEDAIPDEVPLDAGRVRDTIRKFPRDVDALIIDAAGAVVFPPFGGPLSDHERAFLERTRAIWEGGMLVTLAGRGGSDRPDARGRSERGWLAFFSGGAQHFMWWNFDGRRIVALEVPNVVFLSELVMQLPDTPVEPTAEAATAGDAVLGLAEGRTELLDATGEAIYKWGTYTPRVQEQPKATMALNEPLKGWSLRHYAPESNLPAQIESTLRAWLIGGLSGLALALGVGAWLIWRVRTREMKLARERVSFVNQVSHELKTPLTNIRMYTELLKGRLDAEDLLVPGEPMTRHMDVLERETDRLSRMIKNVLSFARGHEDKLKISRRDAVPDEVVRAMLTTFAPTLAQSGLKVETDLQASGRMPLDADFVEQVLANLVSNVEKYGKSGGVVRVSTRMDVAAQRLTLTVADEGPGIPSEFREKIFEPFWRMSDKTTDAATGTGIGLDIARRLARLHGGDLVLVPTPRGATFEATFTGT